MTRSQRLQLPYMLPSQAQKHVTHNEALQRLDILVQLAVDSFDSSLPPEIPADGEIHALGSSPTGAWAGHAGEIAAWIDGVWLFVAPQAGWQALDKTTGRIKRHTGADWQDIPPPDLSPIRS